ncbi:MAG: phospholipase/Carboxylesterase [Chitinophagaceae bacterium]|nr:phospholipase/Carboxylesterase [Chitinophagaceae bacterium]
MSTTNFSSHAQTKEPSLFYIYRAPKIKTDRPPLILLLHGVGSNEKDLFALADQLPDRFLVVSARGPYAVSHDGYGWYELHFENGKPIYKKEQAEKSRLLLLRFIEQLKEKHTFDAQQVYLCGFSQGGIMSYSVGLTNPEKIKGLAVMSGRLLEEIKTITAPVEQLKALGIFISHGTQDRVLPIQNARDAKAYLNQLGLTPLYKEYPVGHTINNEMFADLLRWLK